MLVAHLKVVLRVLLREKRFAVINIAGLAVGMASVLLIASFVDFETSYDAFHANAQKIYRICTKSRAPGNSSEMVLASSPDPLPRTLLTDYPGMFKVARLFYDESWISSSDKSFKERLYCTDRSFFEVFSFPFIQGNPRTALEDPLSVVVSTKFARKVFGDADPMGKTLTMFNTPFRISGVLEDFPVNSSIQCDVIIPAATRERFDPGFEDKWYSWGTHTFVMFTGPMTPDDLRGQFPVIIQKHLPDFLKNGTSFVLEPLGDVHLNSDVQYDLVPPMSRGFLTVLMLIGGGILLISCANFANLSVARYFTRAKELRVRHMLGARRVHLVLQVLGESTVMSAIALAIGITLAELSLGWFRSLVGKQIELYPIFVFPNFAYVMGFGLVVGILAGIYPALAYSGAVPMRLSQAYSVQGNRAIARVLLATGQFVIAAILISGVIGIRRQIAFMRDHDLGFDPKDIVAVSVRNPGLVMQERGMQAFVAALEQETSAHGIVSVAVSEHVPGDYFNNTFGVTPVGAGDDHPTKMVVSSIDEHFLSTYSATLVEGRNFSRERKSDLTDAVVINQSAARALGWDAPVGKQIWYIHEHHPLTIIGVVKDMHIAGLQHAIEPLVYRYAAFDFQRSFVSVRLDAGRAAEGLSIIRERWARMVPSAPLEYAFIRDSFDAKYASEQNLEQVVGVFSVLAIVLAGTGLLGLVSLKVAQRTKEIGVRKVLGATLPGLLALLSREFLLMIAAANVIALPISYLVLQRWLEDFAFRTTVGIDVFLLTIAMTMLIALLTLSVQALKAAMANPVEALRYE